MQTILDEIQKERKRQDRLWGADRWLTTQEWLTILIEEIGEVAKAMQEGEWTEIRTELIQVAAVCVAWLENIDRILNETSK